MRPWNIKIPTHLLRFPRVKFRESSCPSFSTGTEPSSMFLNPNSPTPDSGIRIRTAYMLHNWPPRKPLPRHGIDMTHSWSDQSQSSSDSSCLASLCLRCRSLSSSWLTFVLASTPALINRASRSRVVKSSGVRPSPSKPIILSAPMPLMKAMTQGSTWTFNFVTRNGQLSTLIFNRRAS